MDQQSTSSTQIGKLFADRYLVERVLGQGGMGRVYLAKDTIVGEEVALKILHTEFSDDPRHAQRFIREVQLNRKINHPNIVKTFDVNSFEGRLFLTMEFVEGETLKDLLARETLPLERTVMILRQICDGLAAVHEANIIHRDLKPGNIIICTSGTVKIGDFGVARPGISELTSHDEIIGCAPYIAPEMWTGKEVSHQADLYALGVIGYEMLFGVLPYTGNSPAELMRKHLYGTPYPPVERAGETPAWALNLILKMLEKDSRKRFQSARDISTALAVPKNPVSAVPAADIPKTIVPVVDSALASALAEAEERVKLSSPPHDKTTVTLAPGNVTPPSALSGALTAPSHRKRNPTHTNLHQSTALKFSAALTTPQRVRKPTGRLQQHGVIDDTSFYTESRTLRSRLIAVLTSLVITAITIGTIVTLQLLINSLATMRVLLVSPLILSLSLIVVGLACAAPLTIFTVWGAPDKISAWLRTWVKAGLFFITAITAQAGVKLAVALVNHERAALPTGQMLRAAIEWATEATLHLALLLPRDIPMVSTILSPGEEALGKTSQFLIAPVPYYVLLVLYTGLITFTIRRQIFTDSPRRGSLIRKFLWPVLTVLCLIEVTRSEQLVRILGSHAEESVTLLWGSYVTTLRTSAIILGFCHWAVVSALSTIVIPLWAYSERKALKTRQKKILADY